MKNGKVTKKAKEAVFNLRILDTLTATFFAMRMQQAAIKKYKKRRAA